MNKSDTYHPNPLSGYIASAMAYCAITGKSAETLPYSFVESHLKQASFSSFISSYYTSASDTQFPAIFQSSTDMKGLQTLMDQYLKLAR